MKAKCADCGKRTSIDAALLGEDEEARHFECVPDEPLDVERVGKLLARAGIARRGVEVHDGEGKPDPAPRHGKLPKVDGSQMTITSSTLDARTA